MAILHTDIPTRSQVDALMTARDPHSVSLYLPTDPASSGEAERVALKNLTGEALEQLRALLAEGVRVHPSRSRRGRRPGGAAQTHACP